MTMSSNRFVYAVLIALFIAVLPMNHPVDILPDEDMVQSAGGVLEDYELYLESSSKLTTIEPSGSYSEDTLLSLIHI